jgi:hypothetical protein
MFEVGDTVKYKGSSEDLKGELFTVKAVPLFGSPRGYILEQTHGPEVLYNVHVSSLEKI